MTEPSSVKTLDVGGKTLAYAEMGTGPAVVIIHGVGGHKEDWAGVGAALASGYRVFAIDMLGFGNSVGGWVAATFAATYPDRVDRLVLIDAAGFKAMFEGAPPVNFDPGSPDEMQKLIDITINGPVARTPGLAEQAYARYVSSGEKAISATWGKSLFVSPRLEELFPKISAPTVVLWGADDKLFPSVLAAVFAGQINGARSELIPDAGHFPQIDQPDAISNAILAALR
jgi:triacylglycerol lipase